MEEEKNHGEPGSLHRDEDELHIDVRVLPTPDVDVHGMESHSEKARGRIQTGDDLDGRRRGALP